MIAIRAAFQSLLFFLFVTLATQATATDHTFGEVTSTPTKIMTGSPCLFRVEMSEAPATLAGTWQGHDLSFAPSSNRHIWYALAGVDVEAAPGTYELQLVATIPDGTVHRETKSIAVARAQFPTEKLRVPQRYVEPDAETRVRIAADKQLKQAAFAHQTTSAEWSGSFRPPIQSTVTEGFGTRRTFNGKLASIHNGLDYHAAPGTPVMAANSGEIVLARELFYEGNCVIIDHGLGFTTLYMHLSRLEVSEGQRVEKGQEIGLSGSTGRATGPHLHVAVRWQGAYLDPAQLWTLHLPELPSPALSTASAPASSR